MMYLLLIKAIIVRILKLIATPFLYVWAFLRWTFVFIAAPLIIGYKLLEAGFRGDFKYDNKDTDKPNS